MFPLWDVAIEPVLRAARARRVVEIGALRGETTVRVIEALGPDGELHVIDPVPEFDPTEHEEAFPGRYHFHGGLSLEVLPTLPAMDAALIDGDHNWYTVYHELRLLAEAARRDGQLLPVLVMHDVGWPYGRRDLYYAPEQIPEEHRQPYDQRGMRPGTSELLPSGGLNPSMHNAVVEGGPKNGVMTALDDFIAEHGRPLRKLVLPIYYGLAIIVEEDRIAAAPAIAAALDHLESAEGRQQLLEVAEDVRLRAMLRQHHAVFRRNEELDAMRSRYLDTIKAALLNRHYLADEIRISHLLDRVATGRPLNLLHLRDPKRNVRSAYDALERQRFGEAVPPLDRPEPFLPYTGMGRDRLDHLHRCLDRVVSDGVPGDVLDCGVGNGGGAIFMRAHLDAHGERRRLVLLADEFRASPAPELTPAIRDHGLDDLRADLNMVRDGFERFDLLGGRVRFHVGAPADVLTSVPSEQLAAVRIGRPAASDAKAILEAIVDRLSPGAHLVVELDGDPSVEADVRAFRDAHGMTAPLEYVDPSCLTWRHVTSTAHLAAEAPRGGERTSRSLRSALDEPGELDLTVVVVFYNMRREAERTLRALSRSYQEGLRGTTYEVLAVDNGSDPDQRLDPEWVSSFGPEFRLIDMGSNASASPVPALNRGIGEGRGESYALMIDGAHVVTPGVLRYGLDGLRTYEPAIVATQQWYVGPGQQGDAMDDGYDTGFEDQLFEGIRWPEDGYRLFEIGHFVGDRDWLDGMWESNCIFVPRSQLRQVGGFDERFSMPGGGYANLDLYERLGSSADVRVATILGEGSFHQVHGGTTTNQPDPAERRDRVFGYSQHYAAQRGRPFRGPGKPIHYVGHMPDPSVRRTKARRRTGERFLETGALVQGDGPVDEPVPMPEDLATAFTEAVWRTVPWSGASWLGEPVRSAPTDLLAYQEILHRVRPSWVVEVGSQDAGRSLFLASTCESLGHGEVLSVDSVEREGPHHPRLRNLRANAHTDRGAAKIAAAVGKADPVVVILGSCTDRGLTSAQFNRLAPLVGVGSYVVVTDTIVNGHPVWPAFGPGPAEAVKKILAHHGDFVADTSLEKYSLSFNPGGYLKRVR